MLPLFSHTLFLLLLEPFDWCSKLLPASSSSVPVPRKHGILRHALWKSQCPSDFQPWRSTGQAETLLFFASQQDCMLPSLSYLHCELRDSPAGGIFQGAVWTYRTRDIWKRHHSRAGAGGEHLSWHWEGASPVLLGLLLPAVSPRTTMVTLLTWRSCCLQKSRQKWDFPSLDKNVYFASSLLTAQENPLSRNPSS